MLARLNRLVLASSSEGILSKTLVIFALSFLEYLLMSCLYKARISYCFSITLPISWDSINVDTTSGIPPTIM